MKFIILLFISFLICSCENKPEFIQSKKDPGFYLIKNPPNNDIVLKKTVLKFMIKNFNIKDEKRHISIYKYTWETEYFLENGEYDGFGAKTLSMYNNEYVASFYISKCKKDSTKKVGVFSFYKDYYHPDTIIGKCK